MLYRVFFPFRDKLDGSAESSPSTEETPSVSAGGSGAPTVAILLFARAAGRRGAGAGVGADWRRYGIGYPGSDARPRPALPRDPRHCGGAVQPGLEEERKWARLGSSAPQASSPDLWGAARPPAGLQLFSPVWMPGILTIP